MTDDRRPKWNPFDEAKVLLVREFLRREFRDCDHRDYVSFEPMSHVFVIERKHGGQHMLVIPRATFDAPDFSALCSIHLVDALKQARNGCVTLTPAGLELGQ